MEGTRSRGAGRLCRERPESFLVPREGSALSNLVPDDPMTRGGSRAPDHSGQQQAGPWAKSRDTLAIGIALCYRVNVKSRVAGESPMNARLGRRATTTGTLVGTRFQPTLLEAIDSWRKEQDDLPTRPEAVRRLVELGMAHDTSSFMGLSRQRLGQKSDDRA